MGKSFEMDPDLAGEWRPRTRDIQSDTGFGGFQKQRNANRGGKDSEKEFINRAARILGASTGEIGRIFSAPELKAYRINPFGFSDIDDLQTQVEEVSGELDAFAPTPLEWYPRGFVFDAKDTPKVQTSTSGQDGRIFIQTPSSYLPVHALLGKSRDPERPTRILDLCAAPGGKTALIAAETRHDSATEIIANDPKGRRGKRMREVFAQLHLPMGRLTMYQEDGIYLPEKLGGNIDRILVDAECSTDSGVNFSGKNPLNGWSMDHVRRLIPIQKKLALAGYRALHPGGTMVYSTCTLSPEENEGIISNLLVKHPDAIVQPVSFTEEPTVKPILKWNGVTYTETVANGIVRVFPQGFMDSFCLAVIHKPSGHERVDKTFREILDLNQLLRGVK